MYVGGGVVLGGTNVAMGVMVGGTEVAMGVDVGMIVGVGVGGDAVIAR